MEKKKVIIAIAVIVVIAIIAAVAYNLLHTSSEEVEAEQEETETVAEEIVEEEEEPEIEIFSGDERPIAVMIDNNVNAQPQASIMKAYVVYEIIVEGNETRLMAIFKGADDDTLLGPIRSVRHYFLDYMMENDAVCAHLGQSPQAESDISIYDIDDINGQIYDTGVARTSTSLFWRVSSKSAPHNAYTSIGSLKQIMETKGYATTSTKDSVLNYVADEVTLDNDTDITANTVTIPYASSHKVKYVYDEETGRYTRYSKGALQTDETTGENITTKNIIVTFIYNYTLDDGEDKGRQDLDNVGTADGYYITNGKARKIYCKKDSRTAQTVYMDVYGNEIDVNDGNTFINIVPIDADVTFE